MSNIITVPSVTGPQKAQLSPAVQNGVGVVYTIAMKKADGTACDLTGYTVTAVKQGENGATSSLTGALALVTAASGIFSWTLSAEDVGTASTFRVFFSATNGTITIRSYGVEWKVEAHPSATVVAAPGVTGVAVAEAGLLTAFLAAAEAATNGQVFIFDGDGSGAEGDAAGGGASAWGDITGTLSAQTDLQTALDGKETAGAAATVQGNLNTHTSTTSNPHSVTAAQAGALATANNLSELTATQSTARANIGAGTGNGDLLAANNLSEVTAATARTNLAVPGLATANTFTAAQTINVASNVTQEIVKANATQTNDLVQWQNSSGTAISGIGGDGLEIYTRRFYALKNTSGTLKWTFVYNTSFDGFSFTESAVADFRLFLKAGGNVGFTNSAPEARLHPILSDAGTTTAPNIAILAHSSTGTPAAGFGAALAFRLETSTTDNTDAGRVAVLWNTATHASRVPDMVAYLTDSAAEREIWRGRATGSAAAIGFLGATPVARQAHIADAAGDDAATVNAILDVLEAFGLVATS